MSVQAPWIPLAIDWHDDEMFDDATAAHRLAWVCLLCHAKAKGRGGKVRLRKNAFAREYCLTARGIDDMMSAAQKCGSIEVDGENVTIIHWRRYNDGKRLRNGGSAHQTTQTSEKSATKHQAPSTKHQEQSPQSPPLSDSDPSQDRWFAEYENQVPAALKADDEFRKAWSGWVHNCDERRKPMTSRQAGEQLRRLSEMGVKRAVEAITYSIGQGYTGIYEPDENKPRNGKADPLPPGFFDSITRKGE